MKMTANRKVSRNGSGGTLLLLLLVLAAGAGLYYIGGKGPGPDGPDAGGTKIVASDTTTITELRAIWDYQRTFSLRNKKFASSITEFGDGSGIKAKGICLRGNVWKARYEADAPEAIDTREDRVKYFYRLLPQAADNGEVIPLASVIVAIPEKDGDAAFVALCGPVDLANDFSFNKVWKVYKFVKGSDVLARIKDKSTTTVSMSYILKNLPKNANGVTNCIDIVGGLYPDCFKN